MMKGVHKHIIGKNLPLKDVETALQTHWRDSVEKKNEQPVMKASTLNLLVAINEETAFQRSLDRIEDIIAHHPGRMIIAQIKPDINDDQIKAHLSAYSQTTKEGQTQIAAEVIILSTGKAGVAYLAGAVLPLLLPDVPVFFWQPNMDDLLNPNFKTLLQYTDRLIINSPEELESMDDAAVLIKNILFLQQECTISDLKWSALTEWREAIAQIFDSENNLKLAQHIEKVEISYSGSRISTAAVFMAGWLSETLNRIPRNADSHEDAIIFHKHKGGSAEIIISKTPPNGFSGLNCIKLRAKSNSITTIFAAEAINGASIKISTQQGGSHYPESLIRSTSADDSQLLCDELDFVQQDRIYLNTLQTLSEFVNEK